MELSIADRIYLFDLLPGEGNITTLRIIRQLREDLSFSEEEHAALNIQVGEGGRVTWTPTEATKDVTIGAKATKIIAETLKRLSESKKLKDGHISLYERFVDDNSDNE